MGVAAPRTPGQAPRPGGPDDKLSRRSVLKPAPLPLLHDDRYGARKPPCRPRSWANSSPLQLHPRGNARASLHPLEQPNTVLARVTALTARACQLGARAYRRARGQEPAQPEAGPARQPRAAAARVRPSSISWTSNLVCAAFVLSKCVARSSFSCDSIRQSQLRCSASASIAVARTNLGDVQPLCNSHSRGVGPRLRRGPARAGRGPRTPQTPTPRARGGTSRTGGTGQADWLGTRRAWDRRGAAGSVKTG